MGKWLEYKAFLVPGLGELDRDEGLRLGIDWLSRPDRGTLAVILMNATKMANHAPLLAAAASRVLLLSPQSRKRPYGTPCWVLAVWPSEKTVAVGEEMAHEGGMCVIPGSLGGVDSWIRARKPKVIGSKRMALPSLDISERAAEILKGIDDFDGHNDFVGADGKEYAIPRLRELHAAGDLDPDAIHAWLLANGECTAEGAARMRQWAHEIIAGRRHRLRY